MPGILDVLRNTATTVARFVQEVREPPPPPPPPEAGADAQRAYHEDRFEERKAAVTNLVGGLVSAVLLPPRQPVGPPPVTGGAPPISSTEGLELLMPSDPSRFTGTSFSTPEARQALGNLQRFLVDANYLTRPDTYGEFYGMGSRSTGEALRRFQEDNGITPANGMLTPENFRATVRAMREPRPPPEARFQGLAAEYSEQLGRPRGPAVQLEPSGLRQDFDKGYILRDSERITRVVLYQGNTLAEIPPIPDAEVPADSAASLTPRYVQGGRAPWANRLLQGTGDAPAATADSVSMSIANRGCAVTTSAMGISAALEWMRQNGMSTSVQGPVNPGQLDDTLDGITGGYSNNNIGWGHAANAYGLQLDQVAFERDQLNLRLSQVPHLPVIVQMNVEGGSYGNHYVIITGTQKDPDTGETIYLAHEPASSAAGADPNDPNNPLSAKVIELRFNANDELVGQAGYNPEVTYRAGAGTYMTRYVPPGLDKVPPGS
jgi:hypothetical protein